MKRATYEDVLNGPDHKVAEILDGELFLSPRPAFRHARASSKLGGILDGPFDSGRGGPGGWLILDEPELHFGENVVVPGSIAGASCGSTPRPASGPFAAIELDLGELWPEAERA